MTPIFWIILIASILIFNVYTENKYYKIIMTYKKYIQICVIILGVLFFYYILRKNPKNLKELISSANNCIKYMPIDKNSKDFLTPIFDITSSNNNNNNSFMEGFSEKYGEMDSSLKQTKNQNSKREGWNGGGNAENIKRSVSETKKKFVASRNGWKCSSCNKTLTHNYEIDHILALKDGGDNSVDNLTAMCPNCHKSKTLSSFL